MNDAQGSEGQMPSAVGAHAEHANPVSVVREGIPEDMASDWEAGQ